MYDFYDSQFKNKQSSQPASSSRPKSSLLSELLYASKRSRSSDSLNKLSYYSTRAIAHKIKANSDFENFDVLAWCKPQELTYPILFIMARNLLTPPASTVLSESTFSTAG